MRATNNTQRLAYIDFIKFFASVLVILSHCILKYVNTGTSSPFFNLIWLTQMPLFMFAAGLTSPSFNKINTTKGYLRRQIKLIFTLLFPCFTFLIISCAFSGTNIGIGLLNFYRNPETNLWFLWVLFLFHFVFETGLLFFSKYKIKKYFFTPFIFPLFIWLVLFLITFVLHAIDPTILSIKLFLFYFPFYCVGFLVTLPNKFIIKLKQNKIFLRIVLAISISVLIFLIFYFEDVYYFDDSSILYLAIRVIGSFSSIFTFFYIFYLFRNNKLFIKISTLGRFSLQSYYLHIIFLRFFTFHGDSIDMQWLMVARVSVALFILVFLALFIFYYIPFAHLLVFGKSFSRYEFEKKLPWFLR